MREIYVIEDEVHIANFVKINLEMEDFTVKVANNGKDAIDLLNKKIPDLIILDLMLPQFDGWQILQHIREKLNSNVPVIITSAKTHEDDIKKGVEFKVEDYFIKPFEPAELVDKVKEILNNDK